MNLKNATWGLQKHPRFGPTKALTLVGAAGRAAFFSNFSAKRGFYLVDLPLIRGYVNQ